jgi:ligand-binding sensor domain-containing protein
MRFITTLAIFFCCFQFTEAQNLKAYPEVANYSAKTYYGSGQNWCMEQDSRGILYVGNTDGIFMYNGVSWQKILVDKQSVVRSISISEEDIIYVGAVGEFGYLFVTEHGELKYNSLSKYLPEDIKCNADVWKTYTSEGKAYFCTRKRIYIYNGIQFEKSIKLDDKTTLFTYLIDNELYAGDYLRGLVKVEADSLVTVTGGDFFKEKNIFNLQKQNADEFLVTTGQFGAYLININSGEVVPYTHNSAEIFKQEYIYQHKEIDGYNYFGSLGGGVLAVSLEGELEMLDDKTGMQDLTVTNIYKPKKNSPLWITLNEGLTKISHRFPYTVLTEENGLKGTINDFCIHEDKLFIATANGLFYWDLKNNKKEVVQDERVSSMVWSLKSYYNKETKDNYLLIGTIQGLVMLDSKNEIQYLEDLIEGRDRDKRYYIFQIYEDEENDRLLLATKYGIVMLQNKKGKWIEQIFETEDEVRFVTYDEGNLWGLTYLSGLLRLELADTSKGMISYGKNKGLIREKDIRYRRINGELYFISKGGFL